MTNFVIDTDTSRIFIPFEANLRSDSSMTLDIVSDKYLNIPTCYARYLRRSYLYIR